VTFLTPDFVQAGSYSAQKDRYNLEHIKTILAEGVQGRTDLRVSQRGAGANMSVDIAAGSGFVRADTGTRNGLVHITNDAVVNAVISANGSGSPRIDRVYALVTDTNDSLGGGGSNAVTATVLAGTPSGGATLDNLTGAGAIPNDALHLADVVVASGAASIVDANIRSRRQFSSMCTPPLLTDVDQVPLVPHPLLVPGLSSQVHASHDLYQTAYAAYLPRRIESATRVKWRYLQGATATTGNWIIGIYDASGRQVAATASTAFAGAALSVQVQNVALASTTTFDAGWYYVFIGYDTGAGTGVDFLGVPGLSSTTAEAIESATQQPFTSTPNTLLRNTTGGVTLPASNTILGMTDVGSAAALTQAPGAPLISLGVG
jgi:hypothetical protein